MKISTHIGMILFFAFVGCGEDRSYNNPSDPANAPNASSPAAAGTTPEKNAPEACLLATCNPPANTVYDFQTTFNLTPAGCSSVTNIKMFDTGSGLIFFFDENCGVRQSVYSLSSSYTGTLTGASTNLTADCISTTGINTWAIARGTGEYMLVYSCQASTSLYNIKSIPVNFSGSPSTSVVVESLTSSPVLRAAWNGTANAYGLVRDSAFRRLSTLGVTVGGSIATTSYPPRFMNVVSGNWIFVSAYGSNSSSYCSKINSSAALQCNGVSIGYAEAFLDGTNFLSTDYYNSNPRVMQHTLDLAGCSASTGNTNFGITNTVGGGGFLDAVSISSSLGAAAWLTTSSKALIIGVFSKTTSDNIYSEASVANYTTAITDVNTQIIQNKIYVAYAIDGALKVNYSTQNVP